MVKFKKTGGIKMEKKIFEYAISDGKSVIFFGNIEVTASGGFLYITENGVTTKIILV